jgi:hypothetical protein
LQILRIIALCIAAAILYGIAQDQVTARVCIEYFTIGHPRVIKSESPTLLALTWGVLATWWAGVIAGAVIAVACRAGRRSKIDAQQIAWPLVVLMGCITVMALAGGLAAYFAARAGRIGLTAPFASLVPPAKRVTFLADGAAHLAAYLAGFAGSIVLAMIFWRRRGRASD